MAGLLEGGGEARLLVGRPVTAEDLVGELLGRCERVVDQALAGLRQRDEREARVGGIRLVNNLSPRTESSRFVRFELGSGDRWASSAR